MNAAQAQSETQPLAQLQPIISPIAPDGLADDIVRLPTGCRLLALGPFEVYCATAPQLPHVLTEIGRLRELAFRAAGEGTGRAVDLDAHDPHYHHLFVWHAVSREVVGAYRLGFTADLIAAHGVSGLYTHSLFEFGPALFERLGPSLELGRSFVSPAWQGNTRALRLLWGGVAVLLDRHPDIRHLFGSVSVSPRFSEFGRLLIMSALQLHHMDAGLKPLIRARNAPRMSVDQPEQDRLTEVSAGLADPGLLSRFLQRIEQGLALPMLIKHYIELKGRFAGFNVDASFNGTLDGLVFVRVEDIPAKMRSRLGGAAAVARAVAPLP
jgi:putative hemolysin